MSSQATSNTRYRYYIQRVEVNSTQKIKHKVWARLLVDGEVAHGLSSIPKGQSLVWDEPCHCDVGPDSVISFQLYEEVGYFRVDSILRCSIEFPISEVLDKVPVYLIERTSNAHNFLLTFLNPPFVLRPDITRAALKAILSFVTLTSELCPSTAEITRTSCHTVSEMLEAEIEYTKDIEVLAVRLASILSPIQSVPKDAFLTDITDKTRDILGLVQNATRFIIEYISLTEIAKRKELGFVQKCRGRVKGFLKQLKQLKGGFDQQRDEPAYLDRINEALSKLEPPVAHSTHHTIYECLPDTRTKILGNIHEWINEKGGNDRLLWIHGPSGIGKSAIAASLCRSLEVKKILRTSFFCRWDDPQLREPESVIRSIVHGLARHRMDYKKLAASISRGDLESSSFLPQALYECLVTMPLMRVADQETTVESNCIVIDALDQCGTRQTRRGLLSYLFNLSQYVPGLKVIVTACPKQDIMDFFSGIPEDSLRRVDTCKYNISKDISVFIRARMFSDHSGSFQLDRKCFSDNRGGIVIPVGNCNVLDRVDESRVSSLAEGAGDLFIWADIACRHILNSFDPDRCSAGILSSSATDDTCPPLDRLYALVLKDALLDTNLKGYDTSKKKWLGAIVATGFRTPLSIDSLTWLLGNQLRTNALASLLHVLRPVLYEDHSDGQDGAVRAYHQSFIDYITTGSRSKHFCVDLGEQDAMLSTCCLRAMLGELKFNICGLETSYMLNRDIPSLESRVRSAIGPHLSYSCLWWIDHITMLDLTYVDMIHLKEFLFGRALIYWIEALSLMGKLEAAVSQLAKLVAWTRKSPDLVEVFECAHDAYRFIIRFYDIISESTPHLYLSAIPFAPLDSAIARRGREWLHRVPRLIKWEVQGWFACLKTLPISSSAACLASSPNGHMMVIGSDDHIVRLWDVQTTPRVTARLIGHLDCVWTVAFSPNNRYVASGSHDKTVRIWDTLTAGRVQEPFKGHTGPVLSVAFSHDSQHIISGSHDRTIRIWDLEAAAEICAALVGHSGPVLAVTSSPKDRRIASGSLDKTVRIWGTETGESVALIGHSGWVQSVAFSPDGQRIVSGSRDKTIRIWDVESGDKVHAPYVGHSGPVNSVAFSPDGLRILSGSNDKTVRVWDVETGAALFAPLLGHGHTDHVLSVAFFDGWRVVSGSRDRTLRIWDVTTVAGMDKLKSVPSRNPGTRLSVPSPPEGGHLTSLRSCDRAAETSGARPGAEVAAPLVGHSDCVRSAVFYPSGRRVVSDPNGRMVRIWDPATGTRVFPPIIGHSNCVCSVAFSPDGRHIVSGSLDKTMRIWDTETDRQVSPPLVGHSDSVRSVAFSHDGRRIVSGSDDKTVRIWDPKTGGQDSPPLVGHFDSVRSVAFSPDGRQIVSGSRDWTVRVWDSNTGSQVSEPLIGHLGAVLSVAFSPDGGGIVSGSHDKTVRIWDTENGTQVSKPLVGHSDWVWSVAFSPDGRHIVSGSRDWTVRVWDSNTGSQVSDPLVGHTGSVLSVAFSPGGRHIVSGSHDKTVRIWTAETGTQVSEQLVGHSDWVWSVAFSPDGSRIVSGSQDKTVRIWRLDRLVIPEHHPSNMSDLLCFMQPTGWVSLPGGLFLLWIPSELRSPTVDSLSTSSCTQSSPPSSRVIVDFSQFVYGPNWASVGSGSVS